MEKMDHFFFGSHDMVDYVFRSNPVPRFGTLGSFSLLTHFHLARILKERGTLRLDCKDDQGKRVTFLDVENLVSYLKSAPTLGVLTNVANEPGFGFLMLACLIVQ
jgi:hypothetical protein